MGSAPLGEKHPILYKVQEMSHKHYVTPLSESFKHRNCSSINQLSSVNAPNRYLYKIVTVDMFSTQRI